jgi:peptidoglycan hydrolase-like protein with peptidoglycan-binding domain
MGGRGVKVLRRYLDRAGFETAVDGAFGPGTARSVRRFEGSEGRRPKGAATMRSARGYAGRHPEGL